jgi:hypothetical protein
MTRRNAMTDYNLEITSFSGLVPGARGHYRGRVKGPHAVSCHGGIRFNGSDGSGKTTCFEGHELPARVEWDVEEPWPEARFERYSAALFEGDGPGQFTDQKRLIEVALMRFRGEVATRWFEEEPTTGQPGDRLILGSGLYDQDDVDDDTPKPDGIHAWGSVLAEIPARLRTAVAPGRSTRTDSTSRRLTRPPSRLTH